MAQYTTSMKALIELDFLKEGILPHQLTITDYIERGRKLFFNFNYTGDAVFKEYFEKRFMTRYLLENINSDYPPLWAENLKNIVQIIVPLYYLKYEGLNQLTIDKMLSDGIRVTDINKYGTSDVNSKNDTAVRDSHNVSKTSTGSGSGSSTNTNSAFPFNVASTTSVNAIKYKTDGGKVESSNTATDSGTENGTSSHDTTTTDNKSTDYNDTENVRESLTGNLLDKVMKLYSIDFNPIEAMLNELYGKLFMLMW